MNPQDIEVGLENYARDKSWRRITRAELYAKVWSEPIVKIAKEFGISDRGLAKTCKRLEVPVPPRGYWAKLQAGKEVSKLPPRRPNRSRRRRPLSIEPLCPGSYPNPLHEILNSRRK
jgi:hypothetical protein